MVFRCLTITATTNTERSKGTIANQEDSGTVGVGAGVVVDNGLAEVVGLGEEEMSVEVEPSVKVIV